MTLPEELPRVLKRNVKRTVSLAEEGGEVVVVKRFHAPGTLDRLFDRSRARRESRALDFLREREVPAPRPLAVRRREGFWEVVLEHAEGADLDKLLTGRALWPAPPGRVAVALGRLFGRLVREGVAVGDLHAGNVRIRPDGLPLLLDAAHVAQNKARDVEPELVRLAAGVRESASGTFRARFFLAYLREQGGMGPWARARWMERIERRARVVRRKNIADRVRRWWRESGATRRFSARGFEGLAVRGLSDEMCDGLLDEAELALGEGMEARKLTGFLTRPGWERAALLTMHGISCAEPLLVTTGPALRGVFSVPVGTRDFQTAFGEAGERGRLVLLQNAGAVCGAVEDRGLPRLSHRDLLAAPSGTAFVTIEGRGTGSGHPLDGLRPPASPAERAVFDRAFVAAWRGSASERLRIARELGVA